MAQMFQGNLKPASEKKSGYAETYADWIEHGMINSNELIGGPCAIDHSDGALPVCEQIWPYAQKIIATAVEMMEPLLKLMGVTEKNKSPFCRGFSSCDALLQEYVKYCPRTFTYDGVSGKSEDDNKVEDTEANDTEDRHGLIATRIKQFSEEMARLLEEDSPDADGSEDAAEKVARAAVNKGTTKEAKKRASIAAGKKRVAANLMNEFKHIMECSSVEELVECVLCASAALESVDRKSERGSVSDIRKTKSLISRWFSKAKQTTATGEKVSADDEKYFIERDTLVTSKIKSGRAKDSPMITMHYRVLGLYHKSYNKWFMTGEKKAWGPKMKDEDKKKWKVKMRMVEEGSLNDYDDVCFGDERFNLSDVCRTVDGTEIDGVLGTYKPMLD